MTRAFSAAIVGSAIFTIALLAQDGIQQGKIKKVDPEKNILTLTVAGSDRDFQAMEKTRFMGADGRELKDGLRSAEFKEGVEVMFKAVKQDGKNVLVGVRFGGKGKDRPPLVKVDSSKLKPLTEMGKEEYQGFKGGLYPDGKNERPAAHEKAGLALAKAIQPLDREGKPADDGKIVLLSIGMSNTTQVFSTFKKLADADTDKNPKLVIVDGAQGGMTAGRIGDPEDNGSGTKYWTAVDQRLKAAGVTRAQVQAAWIKQADPGPKEGFPAYAKTLQERFAKIVKLLQTRFPNIKLVYLSSRTYGGYARTPLNPEPYAYESGFSVRWLIEQQLKGDASLNYDPAKGKVTAPWLSWGPYLWANGASKRTDGFFYEEEDFGGDGTHPSGAGQQKVARELLRFFKKDATTQPWFVAR